jgi:hypothetical protein
MSRCLILASVALLALAAQARAAVVISNAATSNMNCAGGVCTATAADAVLNEKDFRGLISHGDLTLASGSAAQDIVIAAKVQWAKNHHLTLDAYRGINFLFELTSEGTGAVTLTTNDGGSGGALSFTSKGKMTFWDPSSALTINGVSYTLANDVVTLASAIAAHPSHAFAFGRGYDASVDGTYGGPPVPTPLSGTFNGLGHTISNLKIVHNGHGRDADALFAAIAIGGKASDFALADASVTSGSRNDYIAMFASENDGTITNVGASGALHLTSKNPSFGGGLVGHNTGTVSASWCSGVIDGGQRYVFVAGLVAVNDGTITHSSSSATVAGNFWVSGLVAVNNGTVSQSSASGVVAIQTPHNTYVTAGGLAGSNFGTITQSYASGPVDAAYGDVGENNTFTAFGGGLVGWNAAGATIQDSYATGSVSALYNDQLGGLVGASSGAIFTSWSSGAVNTNPVFGGLIGEFDSSTGANGATYWDLDTSGISDPGKGAGNVANAPGIAGLTTVQFQSGLPSGFSSAVWAESPSINNGFPYLLANPPQ